MGMKKNRIVLLKILFTAFQIDILHFFYKFFEKDNAFNNFVAVRIINPYMNELAYKLYVTEKEIHKFKKC